MEVSREEFNGLGGRVNTLQENFRVCKAEKSIEVTNLLKVHDENKKAIGAIYDKIEDLKTSITGMGGRVIGATAAVVIMVQLVAQFFFK